MSVLTLPVPPPNAHQFSVDDYHAMMRTGILNEQDRVELLEGYVVDKMPHNPPHDGTIQLVQDLLVKHIPTGWCIRVQSAVTLSDSEPEPDLVVVRGTSRSYVTNHPGPADVGLIIEIADSSLAKDREKARIYARAGLPQYWIVNLIDRQVEVHSAPSGPTASPSFGQQAVYRVGEPLSLVLAGNKVADLSVQEMLP
jgi:Uma2 family endonuclease